MARPQGGRGREKAGGGSWTTTHTPSITSTTHHQCFLRLCYWCNGDRKPGPATSQRLQTTMPCQFYYYLLVVHWCVVLLVTLALKHVVSQVVVVPGASLFAGCQRRQRHPHPPQDFGWEETPAQPYHAVCGQGACALSRRVTTMPAVRGLQQAAKPKRRWIVPNRRLSDGTKVSVAAERKS